ncbi:hypothetical protein ACEN9D_09295 [Pseudomonas sp. CT11-2]|jgi:hypothetical protein|uniref:hypothetical protein n=1 Tax=unclassified Pseudomonas TaxID=196821 RepID=UPI00036C3F0F|nr:hypothetical protein [Pseudomonas sp. B21-019]UVM32943.1 hypothetical protein LOY36_27870 [Pseudomonas sp. B21-019]
MRRALIAFSLLAIFLGGCANAPTENDISGIWINQGAIDAAAKGQPLLETLRGHSNLEWDIDSRRDKATSNSGAEVGGGRLLKRKPGVWTVDYNGYGSDELRFNGKQLIQLAKSYEPEQVFARPKESAVKDPRWAGTFRQALNSAYMGGSWKVVDGTGNTVRFYSDGRVEGLPGADHYELCLAGDCSSDMPTGYDNLLLRNQDTGRGFFFTRNGKWLEIFGITDINPELKGSGKPSTRQWLLEKQ